MSATAYSTDGRTFRFEGAGPLEARVGAFVVLRSADGYGALGQVLGAAADAGGRTVSGSGRVLGPAGHQEEGPKPSDTPIAGATLEPAEPALIDAYLSSASRQARLTIGELARSPGVEARLAANGFARHTFMCGQSGSGKTYTLGLVLEQLLLETSLRVVILDPNSDYVRLPDLRDATETPAGLNAADRESWSHEIAPRLHVLSGSRLKIRFSDMRFSQQAMTLALDPVANAEEMDVLRQLGEDMHPTHYSVRDLRDRAAARDDAAAHRLRLRIDNLGVARLGLWAQDGESPILEQLPTDWRAAIFDLGSLDTNMERSIVAAAVALYAWDHRRERQPMLLVIDEAHNVCPQVPSGEQQKVALEHLIAIAGEGRKFGIYLLLVTQRPQKVHESILSQCENLLLMRMTSATDVAALTTAFSFVPSDLIAAAVSFSQGEGLAVGRITPAPLMFKSGRRWSVEGGMDVPTSWAQARQGRD